MSTDPGAARRTVAGLLVGAHRFVEAEFGDPGRPARSPAAQEAFDHLLQLGCLSQALQERADELAALDPSEVDERRRLLAAPCRVRFTGVTGAPAHEAALSVDRVVAAAREQEQAIRRGGSAGLDALIAAGERAGLGDDGVRAAAAGLAAHEVTGFRRELRQRYHDELAGRLQAYRQKALDDRLGEDPRLDPVYRAAREALRSGGFDLAAASEAVLAYQQAVNGATR